MDLKRYEKIDGRTALVRLIEGEIIFNGEGASLFREGDAVKCKDSCETYESTIPVRTFLSKTNNWFVKKPFDVRAEMLARPNEWVGAYKSNSGTWYLVGFDLNEMTAVEKLTFNTAQKVVWDGRNVTAVSHASQLDRCVPIEDIPKEERT
ncbi:hypothetical protein [Exiguobacterium antarcticum]|uniref:hypothetical protein n=1 Tax=Exiguobacterium antarcticum TaxID=132920 RepID=UPI00047EE562|nr:hypothetical protein [Exiguobacterium antarcticum]